MRLRKILSCFLLSTQLTTLCHAGPIGSAAVAPSELSKLSSPLQRSEADKAHSGPVLIHLQTPHGSLQAQHEIYKMLTRLKQQHAFDVLLLEGATPFVDPARLRFSSQPTDNQIIANQLMDEGWLKAAERFLIEYSIPVRGAENPLHYQQNLDAFRQVKKADHQGRATLEKIAQRIKKYERQHLKAPLQAYLRQRDDFAPQKDRWKERLEWLSQRAAEHLHIELNSLQHQREFPMLARYYRIVSLQQRVSEGLPLQEKKDFREAIRPHLDGQPDLLQKIEASLNRIEASDKEALSWDSHELAEALPADFDYAAFPAINAYVALRNLLEEIDHQQLMEEAAAIDKMILRQLTGSVQEAAFVRMRDQFQALNHRWTLQLTQAEYQSWIAKKKHTAVTGFLKKIKGLIRDLDLTEREIQHLLEWDEAALKFYQWASIRDQALIEAIEDEVNKAPQRKMVLLSGGFHAPAIEGYCKRTGIRYQSMMPEYEVQRDDLKRYHDQLSMVLKLGKETLEMPYYFLDDAQALFRLGIDPHPAYRSLQRKKIIRGRESASARRSELRTFPYKFSQPEAQSIADRAIVLFSNEQFLLAEDQIEGIFRLPDLTSNDVYQARVMAGVVALEREDYARILTLWDIAEQDIPADLRLAYFYLRGAAELGLYLKQQEKGEGLGQRKALVAAHYLEKAKTLYEEMPQFFPSFYQSRKLNLIILSYRAGRAWLEAAYDAQNIKDIPAANLYFSRAIQSLTSGLKEAGVSLHRFPTKVIQHDPSPYLAEMIGEIGMIPGVVGRSKNRGEDYWIVQLVYELANAKMDAWVSESAEALEFSDVVLAIHLFQMALLFDLTEDQTETAYRRLGELYFIAHKIDPSKKYYRFSHYAINRAIRISERREHFRPLYLTWLQNIAQMRFSETTDPEQQRRLTLYADSITNRLARVKDFPEMTSGLRLEKLLSEWPFNDSGMIYLKDGSRSPYNLKVDRHYVYLTFGSGSYRLTHQAFRHLWENETTDLLLEKQSDPDRGRWEVMGQEKHFIDGAADEKYYILRVLMVSVGMLQPATYLLKLALHDPKKVSNAMPIDVSEMNPRSELRALSRRHVIKGLAALGLLGAIRERPVQAAEGERLLYRDEAWKVYGAQDTGPASSVMEIVINGISHRFSELKIVFGGDQIYSIKGNGYLRAVPPRLEFGTSFVTPGYWVRTRQDGKVSSRYMHNSKIQRLTLRKNDAGNLVFGEGLLVDESENIKSADLSIEFFKPNESGVQMGVDMTLFANKAFEIDPERIKNREGFKIAQFSSMNLGRVYDALTAVYHNQNGRQITASLSRFNQLTFSNPLPLGVSRLFSLYYAPPPNYSGRQKPTTYVRLDETMDAGVFTPQGFTVRSADPNDDNVGAWVHFDRVKSSYEPLERIGKFKYRLGASPITGPDQVPKIMQIPSGMNQGKMQILDMPHAGHEYWVEKAWKLNDWSEAGRIDLSSSGVTSWTDRVDGGALMPASDDRRFYRVIRVAKRSEVRTDTQPSNDGDQLRPLILRRIIDLQQEKKNLKKGFIYAEWRLYPKKLEKMDRELDREIEDLNAAMNAQWDADKRRELIEILKELEQLRSAIFHDVTHDTGFGDDKIQRESVLISRLFELIGFKSNPKVWLPPKRKGGKSGEKRSELRLQQHQNWIRYYRAGVEELSSDVLTPRLTTSREMTPKPGILDFIKTQSALPAFFQTSLGKGSKTIQDLPEKWPEVDDLLPIFVYLAIHPEVRYELYLPIGGAVDDFKDEIERRAPGLGFDPLMLRNFKLRHWNPKAALPLREVGVMTAVLSSSNRVIPLHPNRVHIVLDGPKFETEIRLLSAQLLEYLLKQGTLREEQESLKTLVEQQLIVEIQNLREFLKSA